jgi:hypothetical protein
MARRTKKKTKRSRARRDELTLPTEPSVVSDVMSDYSFVVHGERKIGKTTLATAEENVLVLSFDPLRPGLAILQRHCPDWSTFKVYISKLVELATKDYDGFPYPRVVVDRVDLAYGAALAHICRQRGIKHPSDVDDWGSTWGAIKREFESTVMKAMALPCGTWFICHSEWKKTKTVSGREKECLRPQLSGQADGIVNGLADGVFAYCWDDAERVLVVRGDDEVNAGNNLDTHFYTPDGKPIREIYMGTSAAEAWALFNRAFHNKQTYATMDEKRKEESASKPKPRGKKVARRKKKVKRSS